jgi:uncharacterized protein (TIGR00255 family)
MTGYGRAAAEGDGLRVAVELRGVNNKGLDVHVYLPPSLLCHEMACREAVRGAVGRGRVEVRATLELTAEEAAQVQFSEGTARALGHLASRLQEEGVLTRGLTLSDLLALPDAVQVRLGPGMEEVGGRVLLAALGDALSLFKTSRLEEGRRIETQFSDAAGRLARRLESVTELQGGQAAAVRQKLEQKLQQLAVEVDPARLEQEVILAAQRADVEEAVVRLRSHVEALGRLLRESPKDQGRRLDHLLQEMQRETSTLLAKAGLYDLTQEGLEIRLTVEQLREQAQNVA